MARYTRYRRRVANRDKYSIEHQAFATTATEEANNLFQAAIPIVPSTTVEGMRKIKHLTASLTTTAQGVGFIYWALVYVPSGYSFNLLTPNGSLYEPSQYVMNCGIVDVDAGPIRISSPLARNLNAGDRVYLIVGTPSSALIRGVVKYAITLQ